MRTRSPSPTRLFGVQTTLKGLAPILTFLTMCVSCPDTYVLNNPLPALYHSVLYYWCVYRPELLFWPLLCGGSLVCDTLTGHPLGSALLEWLLFALCALSQRKHLQGSPLMVVWACFAFGSFLFVLGAGALFSFQGQDHVMGHLSLSFVWVVLTYPAVSGILSRLNRWIG